MSSKYLESKCMFFFMLLVVGIALTDGAKVDRPVTSPSPLSDHQSPLSGILAVCGSGAATSFFYRHLIFSGNLFSLDITCVCRLRLVIGSYLALARVSRNSFRRNCEQLRTNILPSPASKLG